MYTITRIDDCARPSVSTNGSSPASGSAKTAVVAVRGEVASQAGAAPPSGSAAASLPPSAAGSGPPRPGTASFAARSSGRHR